MLSLPSTIAFTLLFSAFLLSLIRKRSRLPLPPGPKGMPLVGNMFQMPSTWEWETYHKWCRELGSSIIHLNVLGSNIIVLDTAEAVSDLIEKRSANYSSRAPAAVMNTLAGFDFNFVFLSYGSHWRVRRRVFQQFLDISKLSMFYPQEQKATRVLLQRLLDKPDDFAMHVKFMTASVILSITYGLELQPENDPLLAITERGVEAQNEVAIPGRFFVDFIPLLKYVPAWFPGAEFQQKAREWRKAALDMRDAPYEAAQQKIKSGSFIPSFLSSHLSNTDENSSLASQEQILKSVAGTLFIGGSDTLVSAMLSFYLAMLSQPEVQKKAQEELDRVIEPGMLPEFQDRDSLPYISAIVKELHRWNPVTPIALPHANDAADVYNGYYIPKGSIIIPNAWAILHNERDYPDPYTFHPERFLKDGKLNPDVRDPITAAFGFGRRICPGRYIADASLWITVASILTVYNIEKAVDENGMVIEPSYEYHSAVVCTPKPFKCSIKPRSKDAEHTICSIVFE